MMKVVTLIVGAFINFYAHFLFRRIPLFKRPISKILLEAVLSITGSDGLGTTVRKTYLDFSFSQVLPQAWRKEL